MLPFCYLRYFLYYCRNQLKLRVMMLELNVEECVDYLKNFRDPIAECERKIAEHARASIKSPSEFDRNWSHDRMTQFVEAYYILKNE